MPTKYAGVKIDCGDRILIVPPLSLRQVQEYSEHFKQIEDPAVEARQRIGLKMAVVYGALSRNYPEIPEADLPELLDVVSLNPAFEAAIGVKADRTKGEG